MFNNIRLPKIKGTKKLVVKNQLLISMGLPSLDTLIGGGMSVGSIFLLEEDEFGVYSRMLLKHYIAEGIVSDHTIFFGSQDTTRPNLIAELPSPLHRDASANKVEDVSNDPLRIAWRYQDMPLNQNKETNNLVFGNTFDMGNIMQITPEMGLGIYHWFGENYPGRKDDYDALYYSLKVAVESPKYSISKLVEDRTVLRIALMGLNTASWSGDIHKFLIKLRFLLRNTSATCFITLAPHLFEKSRDLSRCEHLCDTVIQLKSLANDGNAAYDDYNGLLIVKKLPMINSWAPIIPGSNDWAFKLRRKHFIVEKLHISPELKEHQHREEEDVADDYKTRKIIATIDQQF